MAAKKTTKATVRRHSWKWSGNNGRGTCSVCGTKRRPGKDRNRSGKPITVDMFLAPGASVWGRQMPVCGAKLKVTNATVYQSLPKKRRHEVEEYIDECVRQLPHGQLREDLFRGLNALTDLGRGKV